MSVEFLAGADAAGDTHLSAVDYSPRATNPGPSYPAPLPGTHAFHRVRGRSGDLMVVQLKSAIGMKPGQRAALRSLGLHGPHTAALKRSTDEALWGNIEAVRSMIAVIVLPREEFAVGADTRKEDDAASYESLKYGTGARPGHLWRNHEGDYFATEFDKNTLVAFWSTDYNEVGEFLARFKQAGLEVDDDAKSHIRFVAEDQELQRHEGIWRDVYQRLGSLTVAEVVFPISGGGTRVIWRKSLKRFHDIDVFRPGVTVVSKPADVLATRSLAQVSVADGFLESVPCRLITRVHKTLREYPVERR